MKEIIKKAIKEDRPIIIITKNNQEFIGWIIERHCDKEMIYISPGFGVLYTDIARISL